MAYENLLSDREEVARIAKAAATVYLRSPEEAGSEPSASSFSGSADGRWLLTDAKLQALLASALKNDAAALRQPEEIYDVSGNLLFRDFILSLDSANELRVRTGANKALGIVIVSLSVGPPLNRPKLVAAAVSTAQKLGLGVPLEAARVVCYAYPRLGIVVPGHAEGPAVIDLVDHRVLPLEHSGEGGEGWSTWQPFAQLSSDEAKEAAGKFEAEVLALQSSPSSSSKTPEPAGVAFSAPALLDRSIPLPLVVQESDNFCAPAASQMILMHHGIRLDQREIAAKMGDVEAIELEGTRPSEQLGGLNAICRSRGLLAEIIFANDVQNDWDKALPRLVDEISHHRPIQRQLKRPLHVDVIAGMRGVLGSDDFMIRILDPHKPAGEERLDRWDMVKTNINDLILLHPEAS